MEFGKVVAVLQQHPTENNQTIATAYMALAIKTKVLDRKKEFERVPVLHNLVPGRLLMGNSSFNTGSSLSAGLPSYTRNQIQAIANILACGSAAASDDADERLHPSKCAIERFHKGIACVDEKADKPAAMNALQNISHLRRAATRIFSRSK